ncbi:hypothetical protein L1889_03685 [Paenalcaligenes niemegkensis]|uniref:hypothetical protein n=1 Tax=Paenalcaligenes niemegkensis TaxID=2895469 RepID=UPI001EE9A2BF|nr:hypothetical protein [Paenalcaligenes niemegkensis]MCQ9615911.1 hypothetical protein [Paenalcaligenes niemegkensis]
MEATVKDFHQPEVNAPIESVRCQNIMWTFGKGGGEHIGIPFRVKADAVGYRSAKGKEFSVKASYCPFCGVSTKQESGDE